MDIPFLGGAYEGRSKELNAQQSINLFPVIDNQEAKNIIAMYGTPGLSTFSSPATAAPVRAMHRMGDYVYAVVGAVVYRVSSAGTAVSLGSITTSTGYVSMADNGTQVLIVDGTAYGHIANASTLTDISDGDFPASSSCVFFDGYFIVTETSTGKIYTSGLYDGTTWDALEYSSAEAMPDDLVCAITTKANVWLLGEQTCEVYYNSANVDFPFARVPGAVIDIGCVAIGSAVLVNDKVYWLTNEKTVVRSLGYNYEAVSTPGIDYQLAQYTTINDAIGFFYKAEGRSFYCLTFPTHNKTWVYDIQTKYWHEWQSLTGTTPGRFRGISSVVFNNNMLVGDKATGVIYSLSMNTYTDAGENIRRIRRTQIINKEAVRVIHSFIEVEFEAGVGLDVEEEEVDGYDPQAVLKWSDDGGRTWTSGMSTSIGRYGAYNTRQIWRRLGHSRNRIYELTIESPVKVVILGGYGSLIACNH